MTIKQNGGIFGRNPTLNNVSIEGELNLSDGKNVNIGTSNDLQLYHDGNHSWIKEAGSGNLYISSNGYAINFVKGTNDETVATFIPDSAVTLYYDNQARIATSSTGVSVTGNVTVPSGNGIDFSATSGTGTSELFDDYEEGTWTPVVADAVTGGNVATLSVSNGYYTKVGNLVHVQAKITLSSKASMTAGNAIYIRSLPFTSANSTNGATTFSILCNGVTTITNYVTSLMDENSSVFRLFDSGSAVNFILVSEITDTTQFIIGGTYRAA